MAAQSEEFQPVTVDPVAGTPGDLADRLIDAAVLDLGGPPAPGAHDVVMMGPRTRHVRVLAA